MPQRPATMKNSFAREFLKSVELPHAFIKDGVIIRLPNEGVYISAYTRLENSKYNFDYTTEVSQAGVFPPDKAKLIIGALKRRKIEVVDFGAKTLLEPDGSEN